MNVVALAGGVGGAKLVAGLASLLVANELSVIVNTGDDFDHLGFRINPDLDTVCNTLAKLANPDRGWGLQSDTFTALEEIDEIGGPDWFMLGDMDIGIQIFKQRKKVYSLSKITYEICRLLNVSTEVLPMTDDEVPTIVSTQEYGDLPFQEYFVLHECDPRVIGFKYQNHQIAQPVAAAKNALINADLIIFCPSNPWVSIDPILSIPGYVEVIRTKTVIGVSPIIRGKTVKGPAAKMFLELGIIPTAAVVAEHYKDFLSGYIYDVQDDCYENLIRNLEITPKTTNILMKTDEDRKRLAEEVLLFGSLL